MSPFFKLISRLCRSGIPFSAQWSFQSHLLLENMVCISADHEDSPSGQHRSRRSNYAQHDPCTAGAVTCFQRGPHAGKHRCERVCTSWALLIIRCHSLQIYSLVAFSVERNGAKPPSRIWTAMRIELTLIFSSGGDGVSSLHIWTWLQAPKVPSHWIETPYAFIAAEHSSQVWIFLSVD